jgi:3-O-methylgallate 3,4-dioxygenase
MAQIVFGLGTSHTPMLLADPSDLPRYEENDRRLNLLDSDGQKATFDMMLAAAGSRYEEDVTAEALSARHAAAREAIGRLSESLAGAALDALIVIGDDQQEMLRGTDIPPLLVYDRPTMRSMRPAHASGRPEWILRASGRYYPDIATDYPVAQDLARHLVANLNQQGIETASAPFGDDAVPMGHAFAFIYSQVMPDPPIPVVPILLNALYPPTQPTPRQCLEIGESIARAVEAFPTDARVGIVASGGLSHFVVDEELDRTVVAALNTGDFAALADVPSRKLNSGNAEIRNWICAAGALGTLQTDGIEYIPGYRTRAGTGVGLGFAVWR